MSTPQNIESLRRLVAEATAARYFVELIVGRGAFGTVVRAYDRIKNDRVAIKFVQASNMYRYLASEVCNHRALRHPHVVRFKKVFHTNGHLAIVMEYANGVNLLQEIKQRGHLHESEARWIFQQLMLAVEYCHRKGIASRDIKCDNVLLVKGQKLPIVKLSDFGYSVYRRSVLSKSLVGTLDYMAPEVLSSNKEDGYDACKADIWSCGVVLYVMLVGCYPFSFENSHRGVERIKDQTAKRIQELKYTLPAKLSESVKDLVGRILTNVDNRLSIEDILNHEWFLQQFPEDAKTMNDEILKSEERRKAYTHSISTDCQTNSEIANIINRAGLDAQNAHYLATQLDTSLSEIVSDKDIDKHIDDFLNTRDVGNI